MILRSRRRALLAVAGALALVPVGVPAGAEARDGVLVFAAARLRNALDDIAAGWSTETGKPKPKVSHAASPALARQLEQARRPTCSSPSISPGWITRKRRT